MVFIAFSYIHVLELRGSSIFSHVLPRRCYGRNCPNESQRFAGANEVPNVGHGRVKGVQTPDDIQ